MTSFSNGDLQSPRINNLGDSANAERPLGQINTSRFFENSLLQKLKAPKAELLGPLLPELTISHVRSEESEDSFDSNIGIADSQNDDCGASKSANSLTSDLSVDASSNGIAGDGDFGGVNNSADESAPPDLGSEVSSAWRHWRQSFTGSTNHR